MPVFLLIVFKIPIIMGFLIGGFYALFVCGKLKNSRTACRTFNKDFFDGVVDTAPGFIKVQRTDGEVVLTKASSYRSIVSKMWEELAIFKADAILRPDYYLCVGARVIDINGSGELEQILMLMEVEMQKIDFSDDIIIVDAKNQL